MDMAEITERLAAAEQRAKSNSHRLDRLEALAEELHQQGESIAVMCAQLQNQGETLKAQNERLKELEDTPRHRWESVITSLVTGAVGILIGLLSAGIL